MKLGLTRPRLWTMNLLECFVITYESYTIIMDPTVTIHHRQDLCEFSETIPRDTGNLVRDSDLLFVLPEAEGSRRPYRICGGGAASALAAAP